jgi:hypothetical protein
LKFIFKNRYAGVILNSRQAMPRKRFMNLKPNFYSPTRSHRPLITVPPALTGAAITDIALAEPFIAAGAAVAFWSFFATEKGLSPRGYERNEIIIAW